MLQELKGSSCKGVGTPRSCVSLLLPWFARLDLKRHDTIICAKFFPTLCFHLAVPDARCRNGGWLFRWHRAAFPEGPSMSHGAKRRRERERERASDRDTYTHTYAYAYTYTYVHIHIRVHNIHILRGKSRWLRILSCAIYVKKKWGIDGSTPFKTGQLSHLCP